jgi:ribosome biogenesis GTPase A
MIVLPTTVNFINLLNTLYDLVDWVKMATGEISEQLIGQKIKDNQDINILLLGETGVGKSTFINAIANYFHFGSFKKASKADKPQILIPTMFTLTDEHCESVTISEGSDKNELQEYGAVATQDVKTYVFPIGEGQTKLRLIDSPGMGDPRGIQQDDINCENILAYLSQLQELHAICFLMKPTSTRRTVLFEYCVYQLLSRLEKSASQNIIFIFTNTRGTNYTPGDTLSCLKTIIDKIKARPPYVNIPLKDNVLSLDNEAFRFLVAIKNGFKFEADVQERFAESWKKSSTECWRCVGNFICFYTC